MLNDIIYCFTLSTTKFKNVMRFRIFFQYFFFFYLDSLKAIKY